MKQLIILILSFFTSIYLFADDSIESVLKIKPPIKYYENRKYDKISKYKEPKDKEKTQYDFGIDVDINKELMTIDKLKIDVETKFKGIN